MGPKKEKKKVKTPLDQAKKTKLEKGYTNVGQKHVPAEQINKEEIEDNYAGIERNHSSKSGDDGVPGSKSSDRRPTVLDFNIPFSKAKCSLALTSTNTSEMSVDEDIVTITVPETAQKIVHCLVGKDLFVDKTWCMVKKADILEDVSIEDVNSPFISLTHKILAYKPNELLIGYEPFSTTPNQFMLCLTEAGRDEVLNRLDSLKSTYVRRIEQSKEVEPQKWESLGSEEFVDQFQIKKTRKLISLEWIGDITKRCFTEPNFEDCDPDSMKNGYTCLVPADKETFELVYKKTQEAGTQAVAQKNEASVQTDPEIPTNASTQYAPETEIAGSDTNTTQAAVTSQDLNTFFKKYLEYLLECLNYNEVYDLYHDDYPALYVGGEETQVQQLGTYHQYQSFTDVAAIQGKLVVSSSWHPNYTGIVAIAYANEIPCIMKELEFDSDQTDYEEEKTDDEGDGGEEPELGAGAKDWLVDERREREATAQNTELFDKAIRRLRDIESAKIMWDTKIQEEVDEARKPQDDESDKRSEVFDYKEYKEAEPELELEEVKEEERDIAEVSETQRDDEQEELFGTLGKDDTISQKTSKTSFREQLEAHIQEQLDGNQSLSTTFVEDESPIDLSRLRHQVGSSDQLHPNHEVRSASEGRQTFSGETSRKKTHHHRKHRRSVPPDTKHSRDHESDMTFQSTSFASSSTKSDFGRAETGRETYGHEHEFFDEITDEEEIKEKQDELPLLELNNPVLIWSFVDDLTPTLRLDSPYEVRVVSFSKHDGNLIAGGTASGQVVLWDITGRIEELEKPESLNQNQQKFRKRMEDLMDWRRDIRSKRRVRISSITNQKESHLEKITNLVWVAPTAMVTETIDIIKNPSPEPNLQIITCSIHGDIKLWDLKSDPMKMDNKKQIQTFKTKERFGRPQSLDVGLSPYIKLHRRWKPTITFMTTFKNMPVLLTGLSPHSVPMKYVRQHPRLSGVKEVLEDRVEYKAIFAEFNAIPLQLYISNLVGEAGTLVWEPPELKPPDGGNIQHTCRFWDAYHDGPVLRVAKHPFLPSVCLTIGGHVFAIWHSANSEEAILAKRYYGVYVTDGCWSTLRPSLIRIARSDGVVEIWDLIIQNHAPATTIIVSGRIITTISPPILPEVRGLLGVADYNSAFRVFFIPQQFRIWTESELNRLTTFFDREPERKKKMKEWSKWWRDNNVNPDREEKKQAEEKMKLDEEVRLEKEKQEEARKKYNEEVYKWYMRRRGKPFLWREEAEEKWRVKQEEHMHEMVMAKKKIDRAEMEVLMRPIVREEKNEAQKHEKAQERLKQADTIFRQTVELIFPKSSRNMSIISDEVESFSDQCNKLIDYYYGENFEKLADEQEDIIKRSPWQFDFEWFELLEKYNTLRMLFNDRRRKRSKTLRWLRKKLREELMKEGRKVHIRKGHMARYPRRKIKRRQEHLDWLKQTYGDDYHVYWDKHHPCRRFADRKLRYALDETDSQFLGELSEPDVEDEELCNIFSEGKVVSSLEMITKIGIEHIPEETFTADLDATLITLESRSSIGVKSIPPFEKSSREKLAHEVDVVGESSYLAVPRGSQSPQDDSDVSMIIDEIEDHASLIDNEMQELDYIQQSISDKINTLQTKKVTASNKREISEGVQIKLEESVCEEDVEDLLGDDDAADATSGSRDLGRESRIEDKEQTDGSVIVPGDNESMTEELEAKEN